jgi:tetratricopeptide (TPR) repeat protein
MDDTIDWSIGLLDAAERTLLTRMSTFETGADLDAVSFVALPGLELDVVPAAAALTDKSLLHRRIGTDGSPRFFMLSLVRAQTARLLAEADEEQEVRSRHATFHHRLVVDLEQRRWTELADSWTGLVSERFADVEAALDYGFSRGDGTEAAATVAHLYGFWHRDGRLAAGGRWTEAAFHHVDQLSTLDQGLLHEGAGYLAFWRHETAQARSHWEQATDLFGQAGADRYRALATVDAAGTWMGQMDYADAAIAHCQEGVELSRAVGEAPLVAHALNVLGELARLAGRDSQAKVAYEEGLDIVREIGDEQHQTIFELNLSVLALGRGNLEAAQSFARVALGRALQLRRQVMAANALVTVSGVHTALGELETGAYLLGAAEAALASLKASLGPGDHPDYLRFRNTLEEELGTDRLAELVAEGGQVSLAAAAARVLDRAR